MRSVMVTVVRVYMTEKEGKLDALLRHLHDQDQVRGVTVFRGISGFGRSGVMHASGLLDLSLDLPLVVEFFDDPSTVARTLDYLNQAIEPGHVLTWPAQLFVNDDH